MKAVLFHRHGGPEVLEYADFPTPEPKPGEALVQLKASALNRADLWAREGWPGLKLAYPHIVGSDGAGVVAAVGEGVAGLAPGDRVVIDGNLGCGECDTCRAGFDNLCTRWHLLGETVRGTYAEYIALPERQLLKVPDGFPFEQAAAASLVFLTAWHSLATRGRVQPGETVLVVGAGGGVNTASIQVAKHLGATVMVVGSNEAKLQKAQELGADVLIDRSKHDWSKAVFTLTNRRGVDVVVDNVIGDTLHASMRAVRKGGRILTVGNTGGPKVEFDNRYMFGKHISFLGSTMGTLAEFAEVMRLVFAGRFKAPIDSTFPLAEARAAQEHMAGGEGFGKIVLAQ
jgi:NADPH:quinone reductase-like Zn-dependent oxidoreductase